MLTDYDFNKIEKWIPAKKIQPPSDIKKDILKSSKNSEKLPKIDKNNSKSHKLPKLNLKETKSEIPKEVEPKNKMKRKVIYIFKKPQQSTFKCKPNKFP